jgi:hypothetical protein
MSIGSQWLSIKSSLAEVLVFADLVFCVFCIVTVSVSDSDELESLEAELEDEDAKRHY